MKTKIAIGVLVIIMPIIFHYLTLVLGQKEEKIIEHAVEDVIKEETGIKVNFSK